MNAKKQVLSLFPLDKDKGYTCECCGQYVRTYKRTFNSNMALALLTLYNHENKGFVHLEKLLQKKDLPRCGDASYLRHYGLIEPFLGDRKDGSKRNGHYKITGRGLLFCEKGLTVPKHFLIFNNKLKGFEGEEIDISQALGNKFNYNALMGFIDFNINITENGFTTTNTDDSFTASPVTQSWDNPIN